MDLSKLFTSCDIYDYSKNSSRKKRKSDLPPHIKSFLLKDSKYYHRSNLDQLQHTIQNLELYNSAKSRQAYGFTNTQRTANLYKKYATNDSV